MNSLFPSVIHLVAVFAGRGAGRDARGNRPSFSPPSLREAPRRGSPSWMIFHLAAISLVSMGLAHAQAPRANPTPDVPKARISDVKKLDDGGFLFAVRLFASSSEPLKLSGTAKPEQGSADDPNPAPFSLAGSTLKDLYSEKVYSALGSVPGGPGKPYFGPIQTTTTLAPGGWTQLGVAFPPLPEPPLDNKGNPQPYLLLFSVPELKISSRVTLDPKTLKPILE